MSGDSIVWECKRPCKYIYQFTVDISLNDNLNEFLVLDNEQTLVAGNLLVREPFMVAFAGRLRVDPQHLLHKVDTGNTYSHTRSFGHGRS